MMLNQKEQKALLFLIFIIIAGILIIFLRDYRAESYFEIVKARQNIEIYVCGEVLHPGVYKVFKNESLQHILKLAGFAQTASGKICFTILNSDKFVTTPVNINTATRGEIESLSGIGPKLALNIIEYRDRYGGFKNKEEIMKVRGIGIKKFQLISDSIFIRENKKGEIPYNLELELKGMKKEGVYKIKKDATISDILDIANCRHSAESRHSGSGRGSANGYNRKINLKFVKLEVK